MSPLALAVYRQLRRRVRTRAVDLTYADLADRLDYRHATHPRSPRLHAALTEVAEACRRAGLPCLPAIVCRADNHRPSAGYYAIAHPRARTPAARLTAWQREHARVVRHGRRFPRSLE